MTRHVSFFPALCLALFALLHRTHATRAATCQQVFEECHFTFDGFDSLPVFRVRPRPDVSFTPRIVSKRAWERLGHMNTRYAADVILNQRFYPITAYGSPRFTRHHFYPAAVQTVERAAGGEAPFVVRPGVGIAHKAFHGTQARFAEDACLRLHFSSYQQLDGETGNVKKKFNYVPKKKHKCVVFWTVSSEERPE